MPSLPGQPQILLRVVLQEASNTKTISAENIVLKLNLMPKFTN